jgi:hypothetical protein
MAVFMRAYGITYLLRTYNIASVQGGYLATVNDHFISPQLRVTIQNIQYSLCMYVTGSPVFCVFLVVGVGRKAISSHHLSRVLDRDRDRDRMRHRTRGKPERRPRTPVSKMGCFGTRTPRSSRSSRSLRASRSCMK